MVGADYWSVSHLFLKCDLRPAQEFDLSRGRVMNQARFVAFGKECEINVGGSVEPSTVAAAALGAASASSASGGRIGVATPMAPPSSATEVAKEGRRVGRLIRIKATFTDGEIIIGTGIGATR